MKIYKYSIFAVLLIVGGLFFTNAGRSSALATKLEPGLRESVLASGQASYLVYMTEQADLSPAYAIKDWSKRGQFVYRTLYSTAQRSQTGLLKYLDGQKADYRSYFIVNAVIVNSGVEVLDALAARTDVAYLESTKTFQIPQPVVMDDPGVNTLEWGVEKIRADEVWGQMGLFGEGVVVANIDTGVDYDHPALTNQYRGNNGDGGSRRGVQIIVERGFFGQLSIFRYLSRVRVVGVDLSM